VKFHPLADIFPLMEGEEFDALVADIKAHGLREPVVVFENTILDGRNRYRACQSVGIEPTFTVYQGDDPVSFVISLNLRRRHLDESQRAIVAAKLEQFEHGGDRKSDQDANLHLDRQDVASLLSVSERTVASAAKVLDQGSPELVQAVERGDVSVSAAAEVASLPESEQRKTLAGGDKAVKAKAKDLRAGRTKKSARKKRKPDDGDDAAARAAQLADDDEAEAAEIARLEANADRFASRLTKLDLDTARVLHELLWDVMRKGKVITRNFPHMLARALERELPEPMVGGNGAAQADHETPDDRWIESDTL
jgi:ParB-like chromosome segregation protein Spo0J